MAVEVESNGIDIADPVDAPKEAVDGSTELIKVKTVAASEHKEPEYDKEHTTLGSIMEKSSSFKKKKELRFAAREAVQLLQDNYPEFVTKNIFINVPFWFYAFSAIVSPFLTLRTTSKFVFARPRKATETLLKYIPAENIPVSYGGLKREGDVEFSRDGGAITEIIVKAGSTENVEIPLPQAETTLVWDLTVLGWQVNYKEEFVPFDEGSYTIVIQKPTKIGYQEETIRNSFKNSEPGKVVLAVENSSHKKKRVLFRSKAKNCSE